MVLEFLVVFCHSGYFLAIFDTIFGIFRKRRGGRGSFFDGATLMIFTIESNIDTEKIDAESGLSVDFQIISWFCGVK